MALVRVAPWPDSRDANGAVVPRSSSRCRVTGPEVVLIVNGMYPLRDPSLAASAPWRPAVAAAPFGYRCAMARGSRSTVRWKHDRTRRKKLRDARARARKSEARRGPG